MNTVTAHHYVIAGLDIRSEIPLPELQPREAVSDSPDIEIKVAAPFAPTEPTAAKTASADVSAEGVRINVPDIGRYTVTGGSRILVEPAAGVEAASLRLFLLGSAFGAIFFQRGFFPLHASVVVINGAAVAFSGDSGAGKSTMAAWMNRNGYPLLCDDVCVVRFGEDDVPLAYPGFPRLKLWQDALKHFDIETRDLQRDYFRNNKYHLPASGEFWTDPVPLKHINLLRFADAPAPVSLETVKPADAVPLLRDNTYRYQYISGLGLARSHFLDCVKLARHTGVHWLNRQNDHATLPECKRLIEDQMK